MSRMIRSLWLGRLGLHFKPYRFHLKPYVHRYWAGKIIHFNWLWFDISWDKRTDILGDLMRGPRSDTQPDGPAESAMGSASEELEQAEDACECWERDGDLLPEDMELLIRVFHALRRERADLKTRLLHIKNLAKKALE